MQWSQVEREAGLLSRGNRGNLQKLLRHTKSQLHLPAARQGADWGGDHDVGEAHALEGGLHLCRIGVGGTCSTAVLEAQRLVLPGVLHEC